VRRPRSADDLMGFAHLASLLPVLRAALARGLFDATIRPASLADVARVTGCSNRDALRSVLDTLVAAGLLRLEESRYQCTALSEQELVSGERPNAAHYILATAELTQAMFAGVEEVLDGRAPAGLLPRWDTPEGQSTARLQTRAMGAAHDHAICRDTVRRVARYVGTRQVRRILDLGAGAGGFSVELARAFPSAEVVLFDRAVVLEVAEPLWAKSDVANRLRYQSGDLVDTEFPSHCDLVFASHSLICEVPMLDGIAAKMAASLERGGTVAVRFFDRQPSPSRQGFSVLLGEVLNHGIYGHGQILDRTVLQASLSRAGLSAFTLDDAETSQTLYATLGESNGHGLDERADR
jgi:trans-aconitate methyltransferase